MGPEQLLVLARDSVADPRSGFQRARALELSTSELMLALAAVTAIGILLTEAMLRLLSVREVGLLFEFGGGPLLSAAFQFATALLLALGVRWIGAAAGGQGSFDDSLLAVTLLQFILLLVQVVQLFAVLVLPPLSLLVGLVGIALFFWLLTGFVTELHRFNSRLKVLLSLLGCFFVAGMIAVPLLAGFGISVPGLQDV